MTERILYLHVCPSCRDEFWLEQPTHNLACSWCSDGECLVCDRDTRIVVDENDNVVVVN